MRGRVILRLHGLTTRFCRALTILVLLAGLVSASLLEERDASAARASLQADVQSFDALTPVPTTRLAVDAKGDLAPKLSSSTGPRPEAFSPVRLAGVVRACAPPPAGPRDLPRRPCSQGPPFIL